MSYVKYITDNIKIKEIFNSIQMTVVQAWDPLLCCEPANFGGIHSDMAELEARQETLTEEEGSPLEVIIAHLHIYRQIYLHIYLSAHFITSTPGEHGLEPCCLPSRA